MQSFVDDFVVEPFETKEVESVEDFKENLGQNKANFGLLHNNIRSIAKNLDEFKLVLSTLQLRVDVVILTETWNIVDVSLYKVQGYIEYYNHSHLNQNDGMITYVREDLQHEIEIFNLGEIKVQITNIHKADKQIRIISLYRSPGLPAAEFNNNLSRFLDICNSKSNSQMVFFVGDINIDILSKSKDSETYLNIMAENNFVSLINKHTRVTQVSKYI